MKLSYKLLLTILFIVALMCLSNIFFIQIDFLMTKDTVYRKVL